MKMMLQPWGLLVAGLILTFAAPADPFTPPTSLATTSLSSKQLLLRSSSSICRLESRLYASADAVNHGDKHGKGDESNRDPFSFLFPKRNAKETHQRTDLKESTQEVSSSALLSKAGIPSYRTMLTFVATTILIGLSEPLLSLVDTTMVGQYANNAVLQLAALGPATMVIDSAIYMMYFLAIATTNKIANGLANKDYRNLQTSTSQVLGLATILGGMLTAVVFGAGRPLLHWAAGGSSSPELIKLALDYCQIRSFVAPLAILGMVSQSVCLACLDTTTPAVAVAVASIVNIVGDLALVPRWGMQGAAVATAAASASAALVLLRQVRQKMKSWRKEEEEAAAAAAAAGTVAGNNTESVTALPPVPFISLPDPTSLISLVRMAGPIFFCLVGKIVCYSAMSMRATDFGVTALAAHNVMIRVFFFYATFGESLSQASQTFLPRATNKESIKKLITRLSVVATGIGVFNKVMASVVLKQFGSYFTKEASILTVMAAHADWAGSALLLHPFIMLFEGCILASQDLIFLLGSYAVTMVFHFTSLERNATTFGGVWQALFLFQSFRLVQFSWRVWHMSLRKREGKIVAASVTE